MKKIISYFLFASLVFCQLPFSQALADGPTYDYQIVDQADNPILSPGDRVILWAKLKNTGSAYWQSDRANEGSGDCFTDENGQPYCLGNQVEPIRLGTIRPTDRNSGFYTPDNWIAPNRVHKADEYSASTGDTMSFGFYASVPPSMYPGVYRECFAPVIEGLSWLPDKNLCWDITVVGQANPYQAKLYIDSNTSNIQKYALAPAEEQEVTFAFQNIGTAVWKKNGPNPVHLATMDDYYSTLYTDSWLNQNRPAELTESEVLPGQVGHFTFKIKPQGVSTPGSYNHEVYWLVAENYKWFNFPFDGESILSKETPQVDILIVASPEFKQVTKKMVEALADVKSLHYQYSFEATDDTANSIKSDITLEGSIDNHDENNPINLMNMDMKMSNGMDANQNTTISFELKSKGEVSYIKVNIDPLDETMWSDFSELNDTWIKIDKESMQEALKNSGLDINDISELPTSVETELTPEQVEKITTIINQSRIFNLVTEEGTETIDGQPCRHFKYQVDLENLSQNMSEIMKIINPAYNSLIKSDTYSSLDAKYLTGDIYISKNDNLPRRITLDNYSTYSYYPGKIVIDLSEYNLPVKFTAPSSYKTIQEVMDLVESIIEKNRSSIQSVMKQIAPAPIL